MTLSAYTVKIHSAFSALHCDDGKTSPVQMIRGNVTCQDDEGENVTCPDDGGENVTYPDDEGKTSPVQMMRGKRHLSR